MPQAHEETRSSAARAADRSLVVRNWLFGWYIVEYEQQGADRAEYGAQTLMTLSAALKAKIGRGFSVDALERMRRFYLLFDHVLSEAPAGEKSATPSRISDDSAIAETLSRISPLPAERISHTLITKLARHFPLGWSQYAVLLSLDDADARRFYEIEAADNGWSVRELKRHLASSLYERLALSRDKEEVRRLAIEGQVIQKASDLIKDPVVLEFLGLEERAAYSETDLETAIIDRLQQFLLELGKGFLFEARQKRFSFDNRHFFVDLVFYNRLLRCYVLIDLKRGELTHQDLGQMQMYVNYFDRHVKTDEELPTVGILLCDRRNDETPRANAVRGCAAQQRLTQRLADRIQEIDERYARPLPELERDVEAFSANVERHLARMGLTP